MARVFVAVRLCPGWHAGQPMPSNQPIHAISPKPVDIGRNSHTSRGRFWFKHGGLGLIAARQPAIRLVLTRLISCTRDCQKGDRRRCKLDDARIGGRAVDVRQFVVGFQG